MMNVLWNARADLWPKWEGPLLRETAGFANIVHDAPDPAAIDAILHAPTGQISDFSPFTNVRLVQSLWAGVERIVGNPTLTQPLARMVDPGLTAGMVEYCLGWTLRLHLRMDRYAQDGVWRNTCIPPLAAERKVTVLGTGALGSEVMRALARVGFDVVGWSGSGRPVEGLRILGGADALPEALGRAEILIALLPDTPDTQNLLDATRLALLPQGAALINPGRGTLIDDDALLAVLDAERMGHAVLDVFRTEPLPPGNPFWRNRRVTVTPHVAADTRPTTGAQVVAENLRRVQAGEPPLHLVDRTRGY
ncbi:glyoxylate/hydroxypyruvate reductase A [Paracoccus suum]